METVISVVTDPTPYNEDPRTAETVGSRFAYGVQNSVRI
jgi:hypothetical protein